MHTLNPHRAQAFLLGPVRSPSRSPSRTVNPHASSAHSSHSWRLESLFADHVEQRLLQSASLPGLNTQRSPARAHSKTIPPLTHPFSSEAISIELKLQEALQRTNASAPSRLRAEACLEALRGVRQLTECASLGTLVALLSSEIPKLMLSAQVGAKQVEVGGVDVMLNPIRRGVDVKLEPATPGTSGRLFYFEAMAVLEREIEAQVREAHRATEALRRKELEKRALAEELEQSRRKGLLYMEALEEMKQQCEVRTQLEIAHKQKKEAVEEEMASLTRRLQRVEEVRRSKEDLLQEAQVDLFTERQRTSEATQLYKDLQQRNKELEAEVEALQAALAEWLSVAKSPQEWQMERHLQGLGRDEVKSPPVPPSPTAVRAT